MSEQETHDEEMTDPELEQEIDALRDRLVEAGLVQRNPDDRRKTRITNDGILAAAMLTQYMGRNTGRLAEEKAAEAVTAGGFSHKSIAAALAAVRYNDWAGTFQDSVDLLVNVWRTKEDPE